jgi:hypothetical protein
VTAWQPGMVITAARLNDDHPGAWANVAFVNWAQGGLSYAPLRVQRDGTRARLDGHAQPGATFSGNQIAFTIPVGYRPQYQRYYAIATNGEVTVYSTGSIGTTDRFDFSTVEWPLD